VVVEECIRIAKELIGKGLRKENIADFETEFNSYWEHQYEYEDPLLTSFYSIIDEPIIENHVGVVFYQNTSGGYCLFVHPYGKSHFRLLEALNNLSVIYTKRLMYLLISLIMLGLA
ncbi:MAG TPA: hypothetical protein VNX68_04515, partial [Nitrosopumilaceae archaeon]|nr:hypothetical protein [Nitrosopumilaceae archaeon]